MLLLGPCIQFVNCLPNRIHDRADIFVQFLVSEADDVKTTRGEPGGTPFVMLDGFRIQMLRAIEFDDELIRETNKIDNIRADCGLATKLPPAQFLSAKEMP